MIRCHIIIGRWLHENQPEQFSVMASLQLLLPHQICQKTIETKEYCQLKTENLFQEKTRIEQNMGCIRYSRRRKLFYGMYKTFL